MKKESFAFTGSIAVLFLLVGAPAAIAETAAADGVFASVGDTTISREEFEREVYAAARQTYYHGKPPGAEEYIEFRKGVADKLIDRHLLLEEAERRLGDSGGAPRWQGAECAEASQVPQDLGSPRAGDGVPDALDQSVPRVDVDARVAVGEAGILIGF